jgi:chromosome segregation ATPase
MSSRTEQITGEVRRLVLTCRSLEAQLKLSIPKKEHEAKVAKLEQTIEEINAELRRTQAELEKTVTLGDRIASLETQISKNEESIVSAKNEIFQSFQRKLEENTVPREVYEQTLSQVKALGESVDTIVHRKDAELSALASKNAELEEKLTSMVPRSQHSTLEAELTDLRSKHEEEIRQINQFMVSKEKYESAQARISELESLVSNSIPISQFDELSTQIGSINGDMRTIDAGAPIKSIASSEGQVAS